MADFFSLVVVEDYKRGAVLAGFPLETEKVEGLTPEELTALRDEKTNKWKQPWQVYYIAFISSMAAVVQGMEYATFPLSVDSPQPDCCEQ
jgi:hypothetical protein